MQEATIAIVVIDVRSAHNVGAILRTADAMAVEAVHLVGITPYPKLPDDQRLPHVSARAEREIHKTALGAEKNLPIEHHAKAGLKPLFDQLKDQGYKLIALEQAPSASDLSKYEVNEPTALVLGNEVEGLDDETLQLCDQTLSIPMLGAKESLNVAVAAGIGLYHLRFGAKS